MRGSDGAGRTNELESEKPPSSTPPPPCGKRGAGIHPLLHPDGSAPLGGSAAGPARHRSLPPRAPVPAVRGIVPLIRLDKKAEAHSLSGPELGVSWESVALKGPRFRSSSAGRASRPDGRSALNRSRLLTALRAVWPISVRGSRPEPLAHFRP